MRREELYEMVWSTPMTTPAKDLGVSDSYMARVCTALRVPRPDRGYWAKVTVGKQPPRRPLPPAEPSDQLEWSKGEALAENVRPMPLAQVPRTDRGIHPLVRSTEGLFLRSRDIGRGDYLKPYKRLLPYIAVSKATLEKALDFANRLYRGLEARSHRVVIAPAGGHWSSIGFDMNGRPLAPDHYRSSQLWSPDRPTVVYVRSTAIGLAIVELSEKSTVPREKDLAEDLPGLAPGRKYYSYRWGDKWPSGKLQLFIFSPYHSVTWQEEWIDARGERLSGRIASIVDRIEAAASELIPKLEQAEREAERRRAEYERQERARLIREEKQRIRESWSRSKGDIERIMKDWAEAVAVERFFLEVEQRSSGLPAESQKRVQERLALARAFLGQLDPMSRLFAWRTPEEIYPPGSKLTIEIDERESQDVADDDNDQEHTD